MDNSFLATIPKNITLVAATKTISIQEIEQAIAAGIKIIGENYVQEAEEKYAELKGKVQFHCIGHLQSNKVSRAVRIFDLIQTVDSTKLADEIEKHCAEINKTMPVLIEINIAKEESKTGCLPEELDTLIRHMSTLPHLKLHGLMTMAPFTENPEASRPYFKRMRSLFDKYQEQYNFTTLSMGMSDSYEIAIEEGATMIRLGTKLFGSRA